MQQQQAMESTEGFPMGTAIPPAYAELAPSAVTFPPAEVPTEPTPGAGILDMFTKPVFTIGDFPVPLWMLLAGGYVLLRMK